MSTVYHSQYWAHALSLRGSGASLRKICEKYDISFKPSDTIKPLNNLLKDVAYSALTHKQIITWAELRNNAAHGHFDKYSIDNVKMMYQWVVNFIEEQLH